MDDDKGDDLPGSLDEYDDEDKYLNTYEDPPVPAAPSGPFCHTCKLFVKDEEDLHQHERRHNSPHRCNALGCATRDGFYTVEELHLHENLYHSKGPGYVCNIGACSKKIHLFRRADNCQSHLRRVHQLKRAVDDLVEFSRDSLDQTKTLKDISSDLEAASALALEVVSDVAQEDVKKALMGRSFMGNGPAEEIAQPEEARSTDVLSRARLFLRHQETNRIRDGAGGKG